MKLTPEFIKFIARSIVTEMDIYESAHLSVSIMMDAWGMSREEFNERIEEVFDERSKQKESEVKL